MLNLKQTLKAFFFRRTDSPWFWLLFALAIKGTLFLAVILNHPYHDIPGIFVATMGDDSSYLNPIDNFLQHGSYQPDYRMPGYGIVYLFFRLFFAQAGACNALAILQLILTSIGVYCLALTAKNIFKKDSIFYLTFYVYLISSFSDFFDAYIGSEGLCIPVLILGIYFFTRFAQEQKSKYLFYSGLLITWTMFIRPIFGGLEVLCCLLIVLQKQLVFRIRMRHVLIFLIPFILFEGAWIFRNFEVHKKLVPFNGTGSPFYPYAANSYIEPFFDFAQSWGGVCSFTDNPPDVNWFHYYYKGMPPIIRYDSLPDYIYTSAFNKDSLMYLRRMIVALQNPAIDSSTALTYQFLLKTKLKTYKLSVEREKPFRYFVLAPLKIMGVFLYGPETRLYLQRGKVFPGFGQVVVIFNNLIYLVILLLGLIGSILLIICDLKRMKYLLIIPFIPFYTILMHTVIFRLHFNRYLMPAYPFIIICSAYIISLIYERASQSVPKGK